MTELPLTQTLTGHSDSTDRSAETTSPLPVRSKHRNPFRSLASLMLTVTLLALSMLLILAGTTAQQRMSVWDVQHTYFHSWFCFLELRQLLPLWNWGQQHIGGAFLFPGGYTLIVLLLINLLAAHVSRFKFTWKRSGILLTHGGLILLLVGELITSQVSRESQMQLDVNGTANFTFDVREVELAITDPSPEGHDLETIIPIGKLSRGGLIEGANLPFAVKIDAFYRNSRVLGPMQAGAAKDDRATVGPGVGLTLMPSPPVSGTDSSQNVDLPSAYVSVIDPANGKSIETHLVSTLPMEPPFPAIDSPQTFTFNSKTYWMQLRHVRSYKPYTVKLLNFTHDRYVGTDLDRNFASTIQLTDAARGVDRQIKIWMNHPLRYNGETFFQASFIPGDRTSILQVVHNPGWLIPYISCVMVGAGLLVHFLIHLIRFLIRGPQARQRDAREARPRTNPLPAMVVAGFCVFYFGSQFAPPRSDSAFDLKTFGSLPVDYEGRVMPLDSLARNTLRIISGKSEIAGKDGLIPATQWLLDAMTHPDVVENYPAFRIDHPDIINLLGLDEHQTRFSLKEVQTNLPKLQAQYEQASMIAPKDRDLFQRKVIELGEHLILFNKLAGVEELYLSAPLVNPQWRTFKEAADDLQKNNNRDPSVESLNGMFRAANAGQSEDFNSLASAYRDLLKSKMPATLRRLDVEVLFNRLSPFITCMAFYVIALLLAAVSWLKWQRPLALAALSVLIVTLGIHTLGLATRIYIQGRPPVTNLYSSAIFIAWAVCLFCVFMELIYRNGVAVAAASALAFPSLLIAHYLAVTSENGDTMHMLRAVLDTNIWLATHVVVVTLGYSATFLAGFLGIGYVLTRTAGKLSAEVDLSLSRMIYGVICFAMLFSFVGTILGGIWADQSWGRFWGWDPKENGAVLIVVWNAIVLHARFGGLVARRGTALMAVFGNIVTAWSWFGTNMLGVGLHSYGFMESGTYWLGLWMGLQVMIIAIGLIPIMPRLAATPSR